jgi:hypothetical protein
MITKAMEGPLPNKLGPPRTRTLYNKVERSGGLTPLGDSILMTAPPCTERLHRAAPIQRLSALI